MRRSLAYAAALAVIVLLAWLQHAYAHDWYDPACCSGKDCKPYPASHVEARPEGWYLTTLDRVVPYEQARPSQDQDFHVCVLPSGLLMCLYAPGAGG